jgi:hypothetical protein
LLRHEQDVASPRPQFCMKTCSRVLILAALSLSIVNGAAVRTGASGASSAALKETPAGARSPGLFRPQEVFDEKATRTAAQKKIDSQLLYALKQKRGETRGVPSDPIKLDLDQKGRALVDITAIVTAEVLAQIRKLGGESISNDARYHTIRARLALEKLEVLAKRNDVRFIAPAARAMLNSSSPD